MLFKELRSPCFKEYHLFFLSDVDDSIIRKLANLDQNDVVKTVQRVYCNYFAVNEEFFHSGVGASSFGEDSVMVS